LEERGKFGRAYSLFHLCFEECGRFYILYNLFGKFLRNEIHPKEISYGKLKKLGYEKHDTKISESFNGIYQTSSVLLMIAKDQTSNESYKDQLQIFIDELDSIVEEMKQYESEMNRLKNVGLYITFHENNFHLPDRTITVTQFYRIKKFAELGLKSLDRIMEFAKSKGGFKEFKN